MQIIININDRLVTFVKKMCTTRNMVFTAAMVLFCAGLFIFSETVNIPNQLHEGDLIVAEELNENFQALRDRDLDSLVDVDTGGAESGQYLKYVSGEWVASDGDPVTGDDLGNHTAGGNLNMNGNYLSGDGDSEGVFVDEDGNVGIGTTGPNSMLEVAGTIACTSGGFRLPDGTVLDDASDLGGGSGYWSSATGGIHYSSGNVGIGTIEPKNKLHIEQSGGLPITLEPRDWSGIYFNNYFDTGSWQRKYIKDGPGAGITMDSGGSLKFYAWPSGSLESNLPQIIPKIHIQNNNGNVGIGTESPDEKFEIEFDTTNRDVEIGQGSSDPDITFITLRSPNGTKYYITVDDSGNLTTSLSKP